MSDLRSQLRLVETELALLLALNREAEITPAQLEKLDALLSARGQLIDKHIALIHCPDKHAA